MSHRANDDLVEVKVGVKNFSDTFERIFNFLTTCFRIPKRLTKEAKFRNIIMMILPLTLIVLLTTYALIVHLLPFLISDFGRNETGKLSTDYWVVTICFDCSAIIVILVTIIAWIVKLSKDWVVKFITFMISVTFIPGLFVFKQVFGFQIVFFTAAGVILLFTIQNFNTTQNVLTTVFLIWLCVPSAVWRIWEIVMSIVLTHDDWEIRFARTRTENVIRLVFELVGTFLLQIHVFGLVFQMRLSFNNYRKKILKLLNYLTMSREDEEEEENGQKKSTGINEFLENGFGEYFSSELNDLFANVKIITSEMRSFVPEGFHDKLILSTPKNTQPRKIRVGPIQKRRTRKRSLSNSSESSSRRRTSSGNYDEEFSDDEEDTDSYNTSGNSDVLRTGLGFSQDSSATLVAVVFNQMLSTDASFGSNQSSYSQIGGTNAHSLLFNKVSEKTRMFKGNLVEFNQNSFLIVFKTRKGGSKSGVDSRALKFANAVKSNIQKINEEYLSDTLSFIRAGIVLHSGVVSNLVLGNRKRKVSVYFGSSKDVALGICQFALKLSQDDTHVIASDSIELDERKMSDLIKREPMDVLVFPEEALTSKSPMFKVFEIKFEGQDLDKGEHSWMMKSKSNKDYELMDKAFEALLEDKLDEMIEMLKVEGKNDSKLVKAAQLSKEKGKSMKDCVEEAKKAFLKYPFLKFVSVFDALK